MHNILICLCLVMPLLVMGMPDITGFQRLDECVQRGQSVSDHHFQLPFDFCWLIEFFVR